MRNKAVHAEARGGATIEVRFADGSLRTLDLEERLSQGIFAELRDSVLFRQVSIDEIGGAEWPNGASLSPEFLQSLLAQPAPSATRE